MIDECSGSVGACTCTHAPQRHGCSPVIYSLLYPLAYFPRGCREDDHLIVRVSGSFPSNSRCSPQPRVQMCTAKTRPCASTLKSGQG
jgi:hypothetical protein